MCAKIDSEVNGYSTGASMPYLRRFYSLHSAIVCVFLLSGMIRNGGNRKYIPVNPNGLRSLVSLQSNKLWSNEADRGPCIRAYVNVLSSAVDEDLAAVCCSNLDEKKHVINIEQYRSNLCHPRMPVFGVPPHRVPFALRLTRPVEAWVLPLLPIFIRLIFQLVMLMHSALLRYRGCQGESTSTSYCKSIMTTLRRLLFYVLLLNFRGWCLYIGANAVEDYIVLPWLTGYTTVSQLRTIPMSDMDHDLYSNTEPSCWYKDVLKPHHKLATDIDGHYGCYGRSFDFSDHVVLFLAHYIPTFVMEMLVYHAYPFWETATTDEGTTQRSRAHFFSKGVIWDALHIFLFLYMHLLIFHVLKQTATYFHTPAEILVGYGISMTVQVPLMCLMCSERFHWIKHAIGVPFHKQVIRKGD